MEEGETLRSRAEGRADRSQSNERPRSSEKLTIRSTATPPKLSRRNLETTRSSRKKKKRSPSALTPLQYAKDTCPPRSERGDVDRGDARHPTDTPKRPRPDGSEGPENPIQKVKHYLSFEQHCAKHCCSPLMKCI